MFWVNPYTANKYSLVHCCLCPQHCHSIKGRELSWAHTSLPMSEPCSITAGHRIWQMWALVGFISKAFQRLLGTLAEFPWELPDSFCPSGCQNFYASSRSPPHHPCKPLPSSYAFIISLSWFLVREARISMMTPSLVPKPWGRNLYVLECSAPVSCSACTAFSEALVMASSALFC